MRRGEVWWAEFDERRPVVLLSEEEPSGFQAMQVVAPADSDISGLGIEVSVGVREGLPFDGVLRFGFPWPGFTPCTWLTTLSRDDLIERAGALSCAKLSTLTPAPGNASRAGFPSRREPSQRNISHRMPACSRDTPGPQYYRGDSAFRGGSALRGGKARARRAEPPCNADAPWKPPWTKG
jgi:mRNA interferase MazF